MVISKAFEYGQYLGNRYKNFRNIIWMHGNDFQSWRNENDRALVQAVARGIRSMDKNHIHTVELNYTSSGSLDDPQWAPLIELDAAYTYFPTYAQVLIEYNRSDFKPVFMVEANYEYEQNFNARRWCNRQPPSAGILDDAERRYRTALWQCPHLAAE